MCGWTLMKAFVFPLAESQHNLCQPADHLIIILLFCILLLESMTKHSLRPFPDINLCSSY